MNTGARGGDSARRPGTAMLPDGDTPQAGSRLIVLASSAGGIRALSVMLEALPGDLPAAVVAVQHLHPRHRSQLAQIMGRHTHMTVKQARDGEALRVGVVFIAPPDRHLLVNPDGTLALTQTELVHFLRPSADLLFESAAATFRDRVIAVVLTGMGSDGAMGVRAVKRMGGTVIAQDEASSEFFSMPRSAIRTGAVDLVLALDDIGPALSALAMGTTL